MKYGKDAIFRKRWKNAPFIVGVKFSATVKLRVALGDFDEAVFARAETEFLGGFQETGGTARLHSLDQPGFPRFVRRVNQVDAGLVERDRVDRRQNADMGRLRRLRADVAVAVDRKSFIALTNAILFLKKFIYRKRRVRRRLLEEWRRARPHLRRVAGAVNDRFAVRRRDSDRNIFERAAETA